MASWIQMELWPKKFALSVSVVYFPPSTKNMFDSFNNIFGRRTQHKGPPMLAEIPSSPTGAGRSTADRKQTYSKVFRWRLPDGQTEEPSVVEVVGSFTHWQRVPLMRDGKLDAWHVTLHHIEGNRTHHYMLLVNGQPAHDKECDGYAVPHGPHEERHQIATDRGPRVFMLWAQTR